MSEPEPPYEQMALLAHLEDALKSHDWTHESSDDHSAWVLGQVSAANVRKLLSAVPEDEARRLWAIYAPEWATFENWRKA